MNKRVTQVLIAKDIARTASLDIEGSGFNLANGEVFVADSSFTLMSAGDTYADSNIIHIGEGTATALTYSTPDGTAVTGVKRIIWSDAIDGSTVTKYNGTSYAAPTQEVATVSGAFTPVIGQAYSIKIIDRDKNYQMHAQAERTYTVTATTATDDDVYDALATKINKDTGSPVTAAAVTTTLTLTAKDIYADAELTDIDEWSLVNFDVIALDIPSVVAYTADPTKGSGDWRQVRDIEKATMHDQFGASVNTKFPTITPDFRTVKSETYDTIIVQYYAKFLAPTNDTRTEPKSVFLYLADGASQTTDILAVLNPWMASIPAALSNVTL